MSKSMVAVITAVITAIVSVSGTLLVVNFTAEDGTEKEVRAEIQYEENGGEGAGFEPYELSGGQQTVSGDTSRYKVDIKSARISYDTDDDNAKALVVTYVFTNNSNNPEHFSSISDDAVYQNGVALDRAYCVYGVEDEYGDAYGLDVRPGSSFEFELCYELSDDNADVVIEVTNPAYDPDFLVSRTFTLS